jgi:hypothetical protein
LTCFWAVLPYFAIARYSRCKSDASPIPVRFGIPQ